jgi:hypothetical protein
MREPAFEMWQKFGRNWRRVAWLILFLSPALVIGCSKKDDRAQARALLDRISSLDLNASDAARESRLRELEAMPLRDHALRAVREVCLEAHRGLLAAEREQARARAAVEALEARYPDGGLPQAEGAPVLASLAHSIETLKDAHAALPECQKRSRELARRAR